jgi:threonine synthase
MPRFIAGSSYGKNPIVHSFIKNTDNCQDLNPEQIRETPVNEPLVNWHSIDGEHALQAIRSTGGWASYTSDRLMQSYSKLVREREGLNVLPASTAGLIALLEYHRKNQLPNDRYVAILTGRR